MARVELESPVTGVVWKVTTPPGTSVIVGDTVVIVESMKMEIPVMVSADGTIKEFLVGEGDEVTEDHLAQLFQSMKIMRMTPPCSKQELSQGIIDLLRANEYKFDCYVQPLAYFSEDIPGYLGVLEAPAEVVITTRTSPSNLWESKSANCNISSWNCIHFVCWCRIY